MSVAAYTLDLRRSASVVDLLENNFPEDPLFGRSGLFFDPLYPLNTSVNQMSCLLRENSSQALRWR
jgi:hypothetical protein